MSGSGDLQKRCTALFAGLGRSPDEAALFGSLAGLFRSLHDGEGRQAPHPGLDPHFGHLTAALRVGDADAAERALTAIYVNLHGLGGDYTLSERSELDARGGYWCHAGGLSPLWRAAPHIRPGTCLVDYGAGNGLQGLLLQHLYPHRRTTLVELSGPMVERGKTLREALGIAPERVRWVHGSVEGVSPKNFNFIYIYRPLRPEGEAGRRFYGWFARELADIRHRVTIFSIADCLKDFLDPSRFPLFYDDGQLACFSGPDHQKNP